MKKLIGLLLVGLFAGMVENRAFGQVYTTGGVVVKHKDNGAHKVKVVPGPTPAVVYPAPYKPIGIYHQAPYYGYHKVKYHDNYGWNHKVMYDDPHHHHHHHYDGHYHYH